MSLLQSVFVFFFWTWHWWGIQDITFVCVPQHVIHKNRRGGKKETRRLQTGCNKCVKSGRPVILTTVFTDCGRLAKCVFIHLKEFLLVHWNIGSDVFFFFSWTSVFVCCDKMGALSTLLFCLGASQSYSHNRHQSSYFNLSLTTYNSGQFISHSNALHPFIHGPSPQQDGIILFNVHRI